MTPTMFEKIRKVYTAKNLYVSGKSEKHWQRINQNTVSLRTSTFCLDVMDCPELPTKEYIGARIDTLPDLVGTRILHLPFFVESVNDCLKIIKKDAIRNYGTVVCVSIADGFVNYVASDGFTLYRARYHTFHNAKELKASFCIGYQEVKALSILMKGKESLNVSLSEDETCFSFFQGTTAITCRGYVRTSSVKFPKWNQVIPSVNNDSWKTWSKLENVKKSFVRVKNGEATYYKNKVEDTDQDEYVFHHNSVDPDFDFSINPAYAQIAQKIFKTGPFGKAYVHYPKNRKRDDVLVLAEQPFANHHKTLLIVPMRDERQ